MEDIMKIIKTTLVDGTESIIIQAEENMYVTDGKNFSKNVAVPNNRSIDEFRDATQEEYNGFLDTQTQGVMEEMSEQDTEGEI